MRKERELVKYLPAALGLLASTLGAGWLVGALLGGQAGRGAAALVLGGLLLAADRRL